MSSKPIESILNDLRSFEGLVERNYGRLLEVGTWKSRVEEIFDHIPRSLAEF
jgi:hypothetical protein